MMTRRGRLAPCLLVVLLLVLGGCAYAPLRATIQDPSPLPDEIAAYYDYPDHTPEATVTPVRERRRYHEFLVRFPLSTSGFEPTEPMVEFEWFESTKPGRRAAILFNPILGGDYPLERGICRYLAANGFHVALVHRKTLKISPEHELTRIELLLRQGIVRIHQIVDWMAAHDRVDPERMGSFGISMGAIASVIVAAVEPRLKAHVAALPGGSIPDILVGSKDSLLAKPRKRYLTGNEMTLGTMETQLRQFIRTDPIRLAPYVDPDELLMLIAVFDRTIGRANGLRLRKALRYPRTVFLPTGHYTAYLLLPYIRYDGLRFLRNRLQ